MSDSADNVAYAYLDEAGDERLEGVDRFRVESLVYLYLNNWEQALHDHEHGLMEPEIWRAMDDWMTSKLTRDYVREAVRAAIEENTYSDRFVAHLRGKLAEAVSP